MNLLYIAWVLSVLGIWLVYFTDKKYRDAGLTFAVIITFVVLCFGLIMYAVYLYTPFLYDCGGQIGS